MASAVSAYPGDCASPLASSSPPAACVAVLGTSMRRGCGPLPPPLSFLIFFLQKAVFCMHLWLAGTPCQLTSMCRRALPTGTAAAAAAAAGAAAALFFSSVTRAPGSNLARFHPRRPRRANCVICCCCCCCPSHAALMLPALGGPCIPARRPPLCNVEGVRGCTLPRREPRINGAQYHVSGHAGAGTCLGSRLLHLASPSSSRAPPSPSRLL